MKHSKKILTTLLMMLSVEAFGSGHHRGRDKICAVEFNDSNLAYQSPSNKARALKSCLMVCRKEISNSVSVTNAKACKAKLCETALSGDTASPQAKEAQRMLAKASGHRAEMHAGDSNWTTMTAEQRAARVAARAAEILAKANTFCSTPAV